VPKGQPLAAAVVPPWAREVGNRVELRLVGTAALERACFKAALEGMHGAHVLRHSYAAVVAGMGYSDLTIAGLLGHRMAGVTARYAHVPDGRLPQQRMRWRGGWRR